MYEGTKLVRLIQLLNFMVAFQLQTHIGRTLTSYLFYIFLNFFLNLSELFFDK